MNKLGKDKILILILAGILLMVVTFPTNNKEKETDKTATDEVNDNMTTDMYEEYVEKRLEKILSDVEGVGDVKVMLSVRNSSEKVLAKDETYSENNSDEKSSGDTQVTKDTEKISTHIFYDTSDGSRPYVVMENMPVVDGAIIVCEGGDNKELVNDITNAVYGLLNIPVHKIKVMKMS